MPKAGRTDFGRTRAARYEVAMRGAPDARAAEVAAIRAALHQLRVANCQGIVDLAAGHGFLVDAILDFLAPTGVAFAVDNAPEMARRISRHRQIRPLVTRLDRLDIPSGSIETVVSLAAFHHVTHKTLVLRELNRLLTPGGYVVIGDVNEGTPTQQFFDYVVREHCSSGHDFDFLDRAWAAVMAERVGLQHVSSSVENTDWRFHDERGMLTYLANLFSLDIRPPKLRLLVDRWLHPHTSTDGGSIVLPWSLGFHVFRKQVERS